jgi:hypothetical protein
MTRREAERLEQIAHEAERAINDAHEKAKRLVLLTAQIHRLASRSTTDSGMLHERSEEILRSLIRATKSTEQIMHYATSVALERLAR